MGPASPHSAAANELREEANDGRLIAAAAVCLPALAPLFVGGEPATTRARAAGSKWSCHDVQRRRLRREVSRVPRSHRAHAHIAGPPDLAKKLFDLPEGTRVHVEGAIERRSHTFLLGVVNPVHAAPTQQ